MGWVRDGMRVEWGPGRIVDLIDFLHTVVYLRWATVYNLIQWSANRPRFHSLIPVFPVFHFNLPIQIAETPKDNHQFLISNNKTFHIDYYQILFHNTSIQILPSIKHFLSQVIVFVKEKKKKKKYNCNLIKFNLQLSSTKTFCFHLYKFKLRSFLITININYIAAIFSAKIRDNPIRVPAWRY